MASLELQRTSQTVQEPEPKFSDTHLKTKKKKKKKRRSFVPRIGCFKAEQDYPTADTSDGILDSDGRVANHLVVMVHGILGSSQDWRFAEKQFLKKCPGDVIVHRSKCNSSMLTLDGVDVMGERLVEEVLSVIKCNPEVQKISFVGHSLGGLVARYAIGRLYGRNVTREPSEENGDCRSDGSDNPCPEEKSKGKIAGLEPMNFITFATPHLGTRGHKQVLMFGGLHIVEKVASHASGILGRTGKHLFLTDKVNGNPPLLLQMASDCGDLQFMSALQSFRRRVAYANSRFDYIVGWRTSSIRRQNELPKREHLSKNDKYPHVVNVEAPKTASPQQDALLEVKVKGCKTIDMEEAMIRGLTKVSWERVDVSFSRSKQRYFAHSTIQVITYVVFVGLVIIVFLYITGTLKQSVWSLYKQQLDLEGYRLRQTHKYERDAIEIDFTNWR